MTRKNQLRQSGTRLQKQGTLWIQQTVSAGGTFLEETQGASLTFGRDIKQATAKLITTANQSAQGFQKLLHKEALGWQALVVQTRGGYEAALEERLERVQNQAMEARDALKPSAVESAVLRSAHELLEQAQSRVDQRLGQGRKPVQAVATKASTKPKADKGAAKKAQSPLRNYDQLTARDVVSRLHRLSGPQASAVLDYERAGKKRTTVIRAAQQRSAMAS